MAVRGVNIALDDPGASSAGSGDCAFAREIGNATMAASAKDTIRTRIMVFLTGPQVTNVHVDRLVPLATAAESETRDPRPPPRRRDLSGQVAELKVAGCAKIYSEKASGGAAIEPSLLG